MILRYEWQSPPIARAWSYEITLWPGVGELAVMPGYPGPDVPRWAETFPLDVREVSQLRALLDETTLLVRAWGRGEHAVGADGQRLVVWIDGAGTTWPSDLEPAGQAAVRRMGQAAHALVPTALWARMDARRATYR